MIEKENCFYLGTITKTHGIHGDVIAVLDCDDPHEYSELDSVFVNFRNKLVPYFINKVKISNRDTAIISFDDITSDKRAEELLVNCELYLPIETLPELDEQEFYLHEVEGYTVIDKQHGSIGIIEEVIEYKANSVFRIMNNKQEIFIPIADEIVKEIDREKKILNVILPDGLLEVYS